MTTATRGKASSLTHVYDDGDGVPCTERYGLIRSHARAKSHVWEQQTHVDGDRGYEGVLCNREAGLENATKDLRADPHGATCASCARELGRRLKMWGTLLLKKDGHWYRQWLVAEVEQMRRSNAETKIEESEAHRKEATRASRPGWEQAADTLRSDYAKGPRAEGGYREFPFGQTSPVLVVGVDTKSGRVFVYSAQSDSALANGLRLARAYCAQETIRLIGTWPGQWRTDQFELNVEHALAGLPVEDRAGLDG